MTIPTLALVDDEPFEIEDAEARCAALDRELRAKHYRTQDWLTNSEWAERHLWLSPEDSGELTKYTLTLTPWHREPMDALGDLRIRRVVLMWASQTGKTTLFKADIGARAHQRPSPMLLVLPRVEDAELWSKERLDPMFRDTPVLQGLLGGTSRDKNNTIRRKAIPGGYIGLVGANAPAGLAMRSVPIVRADEISRMPASAGDEGAPLAIVERRMARFNFRSLGLCSSPTVEGACQISSEYASTDQREWHVPCPHCDVPQVLRWGGPDVEWGMKWVSGRPETAIYVCMHCGHSIEEHYKPQMNAGGEWVPQQPEVEDRGYWLNALVSMFDGARWGSLVGEFLKKKRDPMQLKSFVNTVWCETWREEGAKADEGALLARLERYDPAAPDDARPVPAGAAVLVRAVDVQDDRLETAVWAFGADDESWLIDYDYLPGDPATMTPWRELDAVRARTYRHESGHQLSPFVTFVDSGGHHTTSVYRYAKRHVRENVWAIKGIEGEGAPILGKPSRNNAAKVTLYPISSFSGKETFLKRLIKATDPGPAYVHLPHWLDGEQLKQFGNEELVPRVINGRLKRVWVRRGPNEMIDLAVYCLAGLQLLGEQKLARLGEVASWMMANPVTSAAAAVESVTPALPRRRVRSAGVSL
jgi:phage terminase large subunit GpA-like protein